MKESMIFKYRDFFLSFTRTCTKQMQPRYKHVLKQAFFKALRTANAWPILNVMARCSKCKLTHFAATVASFVKTKRVIKES